jgi:hypothetical protein
MTGKSRDQREAGPLRVLGVSLLRNEDRLAGWALGSTATFCDRLLILDNGSTDGTRAAAEAVAARHPDARVVAVDDAYDTHRFVEPYAGRPWWVLGIDGDEIYDPAGLARLKARLLRGAFRDSWRLYGHTVHATGVDLEGGSATGYATPPARSIVKLYNFAALVSWRQPNHQRLHGKAMRFRPGFSAAAAPRLHLSETWDQADLRCLHLCFFPRSTTEGDAVAGRANPSETRRAGSLRGRLGGLLARLAGRDRQAFKLANYARGPLRTVSIAAFGAPDAATAAMLARVSAMRADDPAR